MNEVIILITGILLSLGVGLAIGAIIADRGIGK
jgi:hypothetical protein